MREPFINCRVNSHEIVVMNFEKKCTMANEHSKGCEWKVN